MVPSFNTTGPCIPGEHYMLPPERRLALVLRLIDEGKYLTFHAGRQTGKTTSAMWIVDHLDRSKLCRAVWVDLQTAGGQPDPKLAFRTILEALDRAFERNLPRLRRPSRRRFNELMEDPASVLLNYLRAVSTAAKKPLVVLFDEADGLVGQTMVSLLTQLRDGYIARSKTPFPRSVVLIGLKQVRDYALTVEERSAVKWLGTTSPFNVTAEAATLGPFGREEVGELLAQHTSATGQRFEAAAVEKIFELSQGHPWLTNALADQVVNRDVEDRSVAVTAEHVEAAKETIILQRRTHIDSLVARLREPRVRRIIEPMLIGERPHSDLLDDDLAYVVGLGLVTMQRRFAEIANPIYREVIPRALTYAQQATLPLEPAWYVRPDGSLDLPKVMQAFQEFWRKDGHLAAEGFGYREAGPHLMLMAFLQRIVNGGGRVEREFGLGRGALDLMIFWRSERHAIEVKLRRDTETEEEALAQVAGYLDVAGLAEGWLVMFDLRKGQSWVDKLVRRDVQFAGKHVHLIGT